MENVIEGINQAIPTEGCHPTQKPVLLMEKLLIIHSKQKDLIIDPFIGGGSTAIACEKLNRKWVGIEMSEEYCAIAKRQIEKESEQMKFQL